VERALAAAWEARRACVQVAGESPIGGPAYVAAGGVLRALDELAEALTGRPDYLRDPRHGAGFYGPPRPG
jgi:hypothetical protein